MKKLLESVPDFQSTLHGVPTCERDTHWHLINVEEINVIVLQVTTNVKETSWNAVLQTNTVHGAEGRTNDGQQTTSSFMKLW